MPFFVFNGRKNRERRNSLKNSLNPNLTIFHGWNVRSLVDLFTSSKSVWNFLWKPNLTMFLKKFVRSQTKKNLDNFSKNWKRKKAETWRRKWNSLKIKRRFHSLKKHSEKLQVLTRGKQKWRFLGLNDAFRLAENTRFHLESSFESATFLWTLIKDFFK